VLEQSNADEQEVPLSKSSRTSRGASARKRARFWYSGTLKTIKRKAERERENMYYCIHGIQTKESQNNGNGTRPSADKKPRDSVFPLPSDHTQETKEREWENIYVSNYQYYLNAIQRRIRAGEVVCGVLLTVAHGSDAVQVDRLPVRVLRLSQKLAETRFNCSTNSSD
jgi:hypothetical protein